MHKITLQNLSRLNTNLITIGPLKIWFSYETPVTFEYAPSEYIQDYNFQCRENDWGPTTGKLLNKIKPNKKARIPREQFEKELNNIINNLNLSI